MPAIAPPSRFLESVVGDVVEDGDVAEAIALPCFVLIWVASVARDEDAEEVIACACPVLVWVVGEVRDVEAKDCEDEASADVKEDIATVENPLVGPVNEGSEETVIGEAALDAPEEIEVDSTGANGDGDRASLELCACEESAIVSAIQIDMKKVMMLICRRGVDKGEKVTA